LVFVALSFIFPPAGLRAAAAASPSSAPASTNRHWAFQPVVDPPLPAVRDAAWVQNGIDRFILAQLEAHRTRPAPPAARRVWLRRATFDLTGLPPRPAEIEAFVRDPAPDAFLRAVDRLLASPRYGERWGRHWLDVARYADSNGMDENLAYANAWRYRDYVIQSFNTDKPYHDFLCEQIAGDLLPPRSDGSALPGAVMATGFLCIGPKMLAEDDPVKMEMDIVDEQLDTTCRVFLGLTVGCGRCHDHKYDPVPMTDYYALAGIFKSTRTMENFKVVARWQERPLGTAAEIEKLLTHRSRLAEATNRVAGLIATGNSNLVREARARVGDYLLAAQTQRERDRWLKAATPLGDSSKILSHGDAIVVEAEHFQRAENVVATQTGYGQGIGVIYGEGGKLNVAEYDVPLPRAGAYRVELRYAAAAARPVRLLLNRVTANPDVAGHVTGSWNPDTQTWEVAGVFDLPAGTNVIRIERDDCIPHFDKLLLAAVPAAEAARLRESGTPGSATGDLVPEFVQQWARQLEKTETDAGSPLAAWHAGVRGELRAANNPTHLVTLTELAKHYRSTFARAAGEERPAQSGSSHLITALQNSDLEPYRRLLNDPKGPFAVPKNVETHYSPSIADALKQARAELKSLEAALPALPEAMAVGEGTVQDLRVHKRGSHLTLGDTSPRGFLAAIGAPTGETPGTNGSGRLELARWMAQPGHPLTARVMVNRIWQGHFGEGLVRSPDNFGRLGETPTHPELLDWLAARFVDSGGSVKAMHRLIMTSAAYQQASTGPEAAQDPEDKLWGHFRRRRLEAEAIRDAILAVAGGLDPGMGGSTLTTRDREYVTGTASKVEVSIYDSPRRSVYLPIIRSALYDVFQVFDFADPSVSNGHRDQTTVAPQALFMLNSRLVAREARRLATTLLAEGRDNDANRMEALYQRAYGRSATPLEVSSGLRHLESYAAARARAGSKEDESRLAAWQSLCRAVFAANEFIYLD
jgi:hypothetical protein